MGENMIDWEIIGQIISFIICFALFFGLVYIMFVYGRVEYDCNYICIDINNNTYHCNSANIDHMICGYCGDANKTYYHVEKITGGCFVRK